jgi:hypothetical protein
MAIWERKLGTGRGFLVVVFCASGGAHLPTFTMGSSRCRQSCILTWAQVSKGGIAADIMELPSPHMTYV